MTTPTMAQRKRVEEILNRKSYQAFRDVEHKLTLESDRIIATIKLPAAVREAVATIRGAGYGMGRYGNEHVEVDRDTHPRLAKIRRERSKIAAAKDTLNDELEIMLYASDAEMADVMSKFQTLMARLLG